MFPRKQEQRIFLSILQTNRQRHEQTDRDTNRQTDRQTDVQTERETEGLRCLTAARQLVPEIVFQIYLALNLHLFRAPIVAFVMAGGDCCFYCNLRVVKYCCAVAAAASIDV